MNDNLATAANDFLAHKRALGRKYQTEQATLVCCSPFADQQGIEELDQLTPCLLDEFVASRPRQRARSFNHLIGTLGCFLDWAVTQQRLQVSPLRRTRRRETARRLPFLFDTARARSAAPGSCGASRQPEGHRPRADLPRHLRSLLRPRAARRRGVRAAPRRCRRRPATTRRCGGGKFGKNRLVLTDRASVNSSPDRSSTEGSRARPNPTHRCSASTVGAA